MKYIRFGIPPKNGKSKIYRGDLIIGEEKGVSVYNCHKLNNKYYVCFPLPMKLGQGDTYESIINEVIQTRYKVPHPRHVFLVTGDEIGKGNDNEPIIINTKILQDITKQFYNKK